MTVALDHAVRRHPPAELSPVAWVARAELGYDEWLHQGARLGLAGRSAGWWIGDWVRYGTARYGSKYTAAARVTGYDRQTLMNMVYVATRFDISRRRENLSWSHRAELAALEIEEQERWLNWASSERLSVRDLRDALMSVKQSHGRPSSDRAAASSADASASVLRRIPHVSRSHDREPAASADRAAAHAVVCPHCGHQFVTR